MIWDGMGTKLAGGPTSALDMLFPVDGSELGGRLPAVSSLSRPVLGCACAHTWGSPQAATTASDRWPLGLLSPQRTVPVKAKRKEADRTARGGSSRSRSAAGSSLLEEEP